MMLAGVEDYDIFGDEVIFWVALSDMPQSVQDKAKQIDNAGYSSACFGLCVCLDTKAAKFQLSPDEANTNVYYVDNDGNKAWFMVEMTDDFLAEVFAACKKRLDEKGGAS